MSETSQWAKDSLERIKRQVALSAQLLEAEIAAPTTRKAPTGQATRQYRPTPVSQPTPGQTESKPAVPQLEPAPASPPLFSSGLPKLAIGVRAATAKSPTSSPSRTTNTTSAGGLTGATIQPIAPPAPPATSATPAPPTPTDQPTTRPSRSPGQRLIREASRAHLALRAVSKIYPGNPPVHALDQVFLDVSPGEFLAVVGPSGSGKTTMLSIMGTLDSASSGEVWVDGVDTAQLNQAQRSRLRSDRIGFVFQQFYLLPSLTALENVATGMLYQGLSANKRRRAAQAAKTPVLFKASLTTFFPEGTKRRQGAVAGSFPS